MKNLKPIHRKSIKDIPVFQNAQGDEEVDDTLNEIDSQMESVTSTGCIAIPPAPLFKKKRRRNTVKNLSEASESNKGSKDMEDMGKAWPRKQKNTGGMHEKFADSKHSEASDGITTDMGKGQTLKTKQKNSGAMHEKFADSKGGTAKDGVTDSTGKGENLNPKQKNTGGMHEKVGKGNMKEDISIESLFDAYAADHDTLSHDHFNNLCETYRLGRVSNEFFEGLLESHPRFGFVLGEDDNWFKENILDDDASDDDDSEEEAGSSDSDSDSSADCDTESDSDCNEWAEWDDAVGQVLDETHTLGMAAKPTASDKGILGGDATQPLKTPNPKGPTAVSPTLPQNGSSDPDDGITSDERSDDLGNNKSLVNKLGMQENINTLCRAAKKFLIESAKSLAKDKYKVEFVVRSPVCESKTHILAEAMADAEELIQADVDPTVEAKFLNSQGATVLVKQVPLVTITPRGALGDSTKAIFRYEPVAEAFAKNLAESGITSRIHSCNWGYAVSGKIPSKMINEAFSS